jgi:sulfur carrier protein
MSGVVTIVLNGDPLEVPEHSGILDLLAQLGQDPRAVAIERNGEILPRREYADTRIAAGDRFELVHFVQGG